MDNDYVPKKQDVLDLDLQIIITQSRKNACEYLQDVFSRHAAAMPESLGKNAIQFIAMILNFSFDLDNPKNPFEKPQHVLDGRRSLIISDLTDMQISFIADVYPDISDSEIQARFADVTWVLRRDVNAAREAVKAYISSAKQLESPDEWTTPHKRIKRSMQIAQMLGKSDALQQEVADYIKDLLDRMGGSDPLYFSGKLMELLLEIDSSEPAKYALLAKQMAEKSESEKDFYKAKYYYEVSSKWSKKLSDDVAQNEMLHNAAEALVKEAEMAASEPYRGPLAAAHIINEAILYYRGVPGSAETKSRILALRKLLDFYQAESVKELKAAETKIDLTPIAKTARDAVSGKNITEALGVLAGIANSPKIEELRKQAIESMESNPMLFIMNSSIISKDGRVIANRPSFTSDKIEIREKAIRAEMYGKLTMHQQLTAFGCIKPSLDKIMSEHEINKDIITEFIHGKPFVPLEREQIYIEGLLAGFKYDLLTSTHLLIPQIENSIRSLLYSMGFLPHSHDDEGIQEEYNLNKLLYMQEVKDMLGEDLTFDLQGLLVEKYSSNLRNNMAHGLMDYEGFNTPSALYLWWITIKLIHHTKLCNE